VSKEAINKLHDRLVKDVVRAETALRSRSHLLHITQWAIQGKKWRRVQ
jgi:hypothetical protein